MRWFPLNYRMCFVITVSLLCSFSVSDSSIQIHISSRFDFDRVLMSFGSCLRLSWYVCCSWASPEMGWPGWCWMIAPSESNTSPSDSVVLCCLPQRFGWLLIWSPRWWAYHCNHLFCWRPGSLFLGSMLSSEWGCLHTASSSSLTAGS